MCVYAVLCPELKVGQYVSSQMEEVKNDGRVVRLSVSPSTVAQACAESKQGWNLTNLLPGLLVKATIKKVQTTFILVMLLSLFLYLIILKHLLFIHYCRHYSCYHNFNSSCVSL